MLTIKANRGAAPMAHLSVHERLDNADQLLLCNIFGQNGPSAGSEWKMKIDARPITGSADRVLGPRLSLVLGRLQGHLQGLPDSPHQEAT
jgi:hypothetical protein